MGMNYGFFDAEGFRRRLQSLTDAELTATGKSVSPGASRWQDPLTISENARKYELCREEWRRRHAAREANMKQYLFTNDDPPSPGWSASMIHATPFRTKEDAEAAILKFAIKDAAGCQELHDYWYVFRESKRKAR